MDDPHFKLSVSVVICTRNRATSLERGFAFWEHIDASCVKEMVLVDNGSRDDTPERIKEFVQRAPFKVLHVTEPEAGLARARNAGLAASTGDVILFTDDDCYPAVDFVTAVSEVFRAYREVDFIGGRILLYDDRDRRMTVKESRELQFMPRFSVVHPSFIQGASMAFRRAVVERVGSFDVRFGAGAPFISGEDTDYLARASWAGFTGLYHPGPLIFHHHGRRSGEDRDALKAGYAIGRGAYYLKHVLSLRSGFKYVIYWLARLRKVSPRERRFELKGAGMMLMSLLKRS